MLPSRSVTMIECSVALSRMLFNNARDSTRSVMPLSPPYVIGRAVEQIECRVVGTSSDGAERSTVPSGGGRPRLLPAHGLALQLAQHLLRPPQHFLRHPRQAGD